MPPIRTPLGALSSNITNRKELTPYERGKVVAYIDAGLTPTQVATTLKLPRTTIRQTVSLDPLRNNGASQPRTGRPKSYTMAEERLILRHVRLHPKDTYKDVKKACGTACSTTTLKRILKAYGI